MTAMTPRDAMEVVRERTRLCGDDGLPEVHEALAVLSNLVERAGEPVACEKWTALPPYLMRFLLGEGPLEGFWFGDKPATERGQFWWRNRLREVGIKTTTPIAPGASHER